MEQAIVRIPALETAPVRRHVNGPESFTPDGRYLLGEAPECRNFFVAAGFNSIGIASGAGAGKAVAEWIVGGEPPMDLWDVDIRRVAPFQANPALPARAHRRDGRPRSTPCTGPSSSRSTARGVRKSVLHDRLAARGACFGAVMGWERANWYAAPGHGARPTATARAPELVRPRGRGASRGARGGRALRPVVVRQAPARRARRARPCSSGSAPTTWTCPPGRIVYTQMLNRAAASRRT